jgi:hypothetical protein
MDGSREQWIAAGGRWSTDVPTPTKAQYALAPQSAYFSSKEHDRPAWERDRRHPIEG